MDIAKRGAEIQRRRKELKLSQEEVAQKIGVTRVTISNWENGVTQDIDFVKAANLALLLDLDLDIMVSDATSLSHGNIIRAKEPSPSPYQGGISERALRLALMWDRLDSSDPLKDLVWHAVSRAADG
jgi:transcriptional regulator with XRE-family HTH domain